MADPAAFTPNREFEVRLGSTIRGTDGSAEVNSPVSGANFTPENGYVKINFRGTAPANADSIVLKIYNNQLASQQVRALPTRQNAGNKNGAFSSLQRLRLPPGLYYFTLERQADEELIFVGKFIVEAR